MRLLFIPVFNYPSNLNADSIYLISNGWCKRLVESSEDLTITRLLPLRDSESFLERYKYEYEPLHERVIDHFVPFKNRYTTEEINVEWETFKRYHPVWGTEPVDAVISTSSIKTFLLQRMFEVYGGNQPLFFNFELLIRGGKESKEVATISRHEELTQAMGQTSGAINLFQSPICKATALSNARAFVKPKALESISRGEMIYSGFNGEVCTQLPLSARFEKKTVMIRGRITPSKKYEQVMELYNKVIASGVDLKIVVTTGMSLLKKTKFGEGLIKNKNVDVLTFKQVEPSYEVMRKAHAFVFMSEHELFCVSVWEMIGAGLIGIIKREPWNKGLLPPDYPYLFDTETEAYVMLKDVIENYEERLEAYQWVVDWVRAKYDYRATTAKARDLIINAIKHHQASFKPKKMLEEALEAGELPNSGYIEDFEELVASRSTFGGNFLISRQRTLDLGALYKSLSHFDFLVGLRKAGYVCEIRDNKLYFKLDKLRTGL